MTGTSGVVGVSSTEALRPSLAGGGRQDLQSEALALQSLAQGVDAALLEDGSVNVVTNPSPPAKAGAAGGLGGGGRERVSREEGRDEGGRAKVLVEDLAPMCYAAILRNPRPLPLHLALCNDSIYFETAFVDVNCLPSASGDSAPGDQQAASGQGSGQGASGKAEVTKETVKSWETGVWIKLQSDLVASLRLSISPCGRMGPATCSLTPDAQVLVVVRLKALGFGKKVCEGGRQRSTVGKRQRRAGEGQYLVAAHMERLLLAKTLGYIHIAS